MKLTPSATGVFPIAPTPFAPDGAIDWASVDRLFEFYARIGSDGMTVLGIMGEAPKLEPQESLAIVKRAVAIMGGKPIVVGVSAPGFAAMRALAREAMEAGAAGVMIAPPSALRTDDQIVTYYAQAADAIEHLVAVHVPDPAALATGDDVGRRLLHRAGVRHRVPDELGVVALDPFDVAHCNVLPQPALPTVMVLISV